MRILIVKTSSLGDIIHAFPVLSFIKKLYPHAEIDWIVEKPFAGLVGAHPLVSKIWTVETKKWRKGIFKPSFWKEIRQLKKDVNARNYDVLFDLQGNIKSALICSQLCVKTKVGYGWQTVHEKPNVFFMDQHFDPPKGVNIRDDNLFLVQSYFKEMSPHEDQGVYLKISTEEEQLISRILSDPRLASRKRLMICPGSAWRNKQVTREALEEFLRLLAKRRDYAFLFVWGTPEEKELVSQLQQHHPDESVVIDRLALPVLQNLMGRVDGVFAMDSLALHLAGTTSTPSFSVFGASVAEKFKPKGDRHLTLQGNCPYGRTFEKRCPILRTCPTGLCIRGFSGQQLYDHFSNNL